MLAEGPVNGNSVIVARIGLSTLLHAQPAHNRRISELAGHQQNELPNRFSDINRNIEWRMNPAAVKKKRPAQPGANRKTTLCSTLVGTKLAPESGPRRMNRTEKWQISSAKNVRIWAGAQKRIPKTRTGCCQTDPQHQEKHDLAAAAGHPCDLPSLILSCEVLKGLRKKKPELYLRKSD